MISKQVTRFSASEQGFMTRYVGLSTDDKPAAANIGDSFLEMDTLAEYLFDGNSWTDVSPSEGE